VRLRQAYLLFHGQRDLVVSNEHLCGGSFALVASSIFRLAMDTLSGGRKHGFEEGDVRLHKNLSLKGDIKSNKD
jgi:hypothetical protein